ncbi:TPA: hypothetical protein ACXNW8_001347 [Clostridium botulinum]|uniref:hypothetical protein n=1 Tax=Clostridium botulinum TaxID=1491 RepID=UPI001C9A5FAD|nr:hypothetical protein [Clostridium botulinum]MBY6909549.1 hypothetical protein [Clostridium botulinum]
MNNILILLSFVVLLQAVVIWFLNEKLTKLNILVEDLQSEIKLYTCLNLNNKKDEINRNKVGKWLK